MGTPLPRPAAAGGHEPGRQTTQPHDTQENSQAAHGPGVLAPQMQQVCSRGSFVGEVCNLREESQDVPAICRVSGQLPCVAFFGRFCGAGTSCGDGDPRGLLTGNLRVGRHH
jgi:hypothetical protein